MVRALVELGLPLEYMLFMFSGYPLAEFDAVHRQRSSGGGGEAAGGGQAELHV